MVCRMVDMTTDHPIHVLTLRFGNQCILKLADEVDCVLDLQFRPCGHAPVGQSQLTAAIVHHRIHVERRSVSPVSKEGQPLGMAHHHVKLVAMNNQILLTVGTLMDDLINNLHTTEVNA